MNETSGSSLICSIHQRNVPRRGEGGKNETWLTDLVNQIDLNAFDSTQVEIELKFSLIFIEMNSVPVACGNCKSYICCLLTVCNLTSASEFLFALVQVALTNQGQSATLQTSTAN